jgi:ABC-type anion transport system duplicated permease subunit
MDEASRVLGLSRWKRFWNIELPSGAIGLVWNGMMSFGGSWFFLTASEQISRVSAPMWGSHRHAARPAASSSPSWS